MIGFHHLRCDNADHPEVPGGITEHDGRRGRPWYCWAMRSCTAVSMACCRVRRCWFTVSELGETLCLVGLVGR